MFNQEFNEQSIIFGNNFPEEGTTLSATENTAVAIEYLIDAKEEKVDN